MVESPCVNICRIEDSECVGCRRTRDEIRLWLNVSDEEKLKILENIKKRKNKNYFLDYYV